MRSARRRENIRVSGTDEGWTSDTELHQKREGKIVPIQI
jgi:hypothetical protein